jgi:Bacteriophage minor capsid protein
MILLDSQSVIVQQFLIQNGIGTNPDPAGQNIWPIYKNFMPDAPGLQDNILCVYETVGPKEDRLYNGETVEHPGIQIKCRAVDDDAGWLKLANIAQLFDGLLPSTQQALTIVNGNTYQFAGIHRKPAMCLGQEDNEKRRFMLVMNAICTINTIPYGLVVGSV